MVLLVLKKNVIASAIREDQLGSFRILINKTLDMSIDEIY